jgi:mRNA interferase RelE/StbE
VSAATQVYYASFDAIFLKLPPAVRARVEAKIDDIGSRLASFPHHRLKGSGRFRGRIGDYRIIYTFDLEQNKIHLLAIGHRREIYRGI